MINNTRRYNPWEHFKNPEDIKKKISSGLIGKLTLIILLKNRLGLKCVPKIPVICYCEKCNEVCWNGSEYKLGHHMKKFPINKDKKLSKETCEKMRKFHLGELNWLYKKVLSDEEKEKFRKNLPFDCFGKNNGNWQGGVSFEPYCHKFNRSLKESIRIRDHHICQLCGRIQFYNDEKHSVHHIHYDKQNCYPDLICLCRKCNSKVNKKSLRFYYESLFMNKLNDRELLFWIKRREAIKTNNLNSNEFILLNSGETRQI